MTTPPRRSKFRAVDSSHPRPKGDRPRRPVAADGTGRAPTRLQILTECPLSPAPQRSRCVIDRHFGDSAGCVVGPGLTCRMALRFSCGRDRRLQPPRRCNRGEVADVASHPDCTELFCRRIERFLLDVGEHDMRTRHSQQPCVAGPIPDAPPVMTASLPSKLSMDRSIAPAMAHEHYGAPTAGRRVTENGPATAASVMLS